MGRPVGIAASPARRRFGEPVEGVQSDDRRQQRMPAVHGDDGLPTRVRLAIDDERRGAERGETVDGLEKPLPGGVRGREGENRKSRPNDPRRPVQHLGGRERFRVNRRGFLEFERRLGGDGESSRRDR